VKREGQEKESYRRFISIFYTPVFYSCNACYLTELAQQNEQCAVPLFCWQHNWNNCARASRLLTDFGKFYFAKCLSYTQGRIKLFGAPRQWKHFRPLFQAVFLSGGGVLPPRLSQTPRPPVPRQK